MARPCPGPGAGHPAEPGAWLWVWGAGCGRAAAPGDTAHSSHPSRLPQDLCEATLFYTELLRKKMDAQPRPSGEAVSEPVSKLVAERRGGWWLRGAGVGLPTQPPTSGRLPQLCVVLNNVELLRKAAGQALRGLAWPEATSALEGGLPRPLLSCTRALDEDLQQEVQTVTAHLTSKVGGLAGRCGSRPPGALPLGAERCPPADGGRHPQVCAAHRPVAGLHPERRGECAAGGGCVGGPWAGWR